ncbi:MAG TPA: LysM peptidoglycan-binding domain-containing protein [Flavobacteriaceae bacterium]|nr:LysM peptidoglycan-binding domain-containing protein [Flavobacteriaceae bacterium]
MTKKSLFIFTFMFIGFAGIAQKKIFPGSLEYLKVIIPDSLESSDIINSTNNSNEYELGEVDGIKLKDYHISNRIDSLWLAELTNSDLFPKIQESVLEIPFDTDEVSPSDYQELSTETLKKRLKELDRKTPFDINYNPVLESTIHAYLKRHKKSMERLISLSLYYFPLFEKELDKYDVPLELKYLPIIESALNPRARSRVGATGLWQFMYATGKMHNLEVNSYIDERMDPEKSTVAAAEYLSELYKIFGDWNLVLASYNYGPGNVSRAIRRSGGATDYWELRRFMPRETANYVPAFLATLYIHEYAEQHGYEPYLPNVIHFETDTIQIKKPLNFEYISKMTSVDEEFLAFLNPSYKLKYIPAGEEKTFAIRLPVQEAGVFAANEKYIYQEYEQLLAAEKEQERYELMQRRMSYRVKSGDYLGKIAAEYGVSVNNIKEWNRLNSNNIRIGQKLVIYPNQPKIASSKKTDTQSQESTSKKYYTVRKGDSIWSISKKFKGVSVNQIKRWNGISGNHLRPGMRLKISEP